MMSAGEGVADSVYVVRSRASECPSTWGVEDPATTEKIRKCYAAAEFLDEHPNYNAPASVLSKAIAGGFGATLTAFGTVLAMKGDREDLTTVRVSALLGLPLLTYSIAGIHYAISDREAEKLMLGVMALTGALAAAHVTVTKDYGELPLHGAALVVSVAALARIQGEDNTLAEARSLGFFLTADEQGAGMGVGGRF